MTSWSSPVDDQPQSATPGGLGEAKFADAASALQKHAQAVITLTLALGLDVRPDAVVDQPGE